LLYLVTLDDTTRPEIPCACPLPWPSPMVYCYESFCFNPDTYRLTPVIMPPGDIYLLDVTFTPDSAGEHVVYLMIYSDDRYPPPGTVATIRLTGTGVEGPTPEEQIDDIQEFFDDAVTSGGLVGAGSTRTARAGRLIAFENMLEKAEYLIDIDNMGGACIQLRDAYEKTDGLMLPPDFVRGSAADELAAMIQELMESLGCS